MPIDQIEGLTEGVAFKAAAKVVTVSNTTLSGLQTIDGVTLVAGDRVLVTAQTNSANNGIYSASSGNWTRVVDFNGARDVINGTYVGVSSGSARSGTIWQLSFTGTLSIGTTALTFTQKVFGDNVLATGTTTARAISARMGDFLNLKDFGAVGDYATDDTAAVVAWLAACSSTNKTGYAPRGNYKCTDNILYPDGVNIFGDGSARIATFPQLGGVNSNKRKLRPTYKSSMSGTNFIFTGTPSNTFTTTRVDRFASMKPCFIHNFYSPIQIQGISIIQDMDVLDSGGSLTTGSTDNRAGNYTAGFITLSSQSRFIDVNIFGYFVDAGMIVCNKEGDSIEDPDYVSMIDCLVSSGLAIIGNDVSAVSEGLTGVMSTNCGLYGSDHHTRADGNYLIPSLYIDGNLSASADIRGHQFTNCHFRTYANNSIALDQCDDICFSACTFEFSLLAGVTNADALGVIQGTSNTGDIKIVGAASTSGMGIEALANAIPGSLIAIGAANDQDVIISQGGKGIRLRGESSTGDSVIQLTDDFSTATGQWTLRRDDSDSDLLDIRWNNATVASLTTAGILSAKGYKTDLSSTLTIVTGAVTAVGGYHLIDTEGAAATDDLDTISGLTTTSILTLRAASSVRDIVVKDGTGNLRLAGGDFTMTNTDDVIVLIKVGTEFVELGRSDNTV